ncbi:MAG TPA: hypothetical protein VGO36_06495 [Solirubrobacterales bacterium]|nr:hypothetical protein [Solirubrobacterales bacterium]
MAALLALLALAPAASGAEVSLAPAQPVAEANEAIALLAGPAQAREADDMVESIGVNTHLGYTDTPYNDFAAVQQRLEELGIRYVRDGLSQNRPDVYQRMRELAADGIHLDVIAGDPLQRWNIGTIDQQLDLIQKELDGAVVSIEGPNEYDLQGDPNWVPVLRDYTQQLWEGVKARPALAELPVVGPSIVGRDGMADVGDLAPWTDFGNTHTYLSGAMPETPSIWDGELTAAAHNSGSQPVQVTETGYHNGVNGTVGHQPASERAAGVYMPRLFLDNFRRGIARSYSYELLDQREDPSKTDIEAAFGLLRNDLSKKPAAVAIERLTGLLSDPGPAFAPGELEYRLEGAPATVQQLLLQKRDGSFYLVLWNRVSVWDPATRSDLDPPDVPIAVDFGQPIASAEVFEPNAAAAPSATAANPSSLPLDLSAQVQVVRLVPKPAPAGEPTPPPSTPPTTPSPPPVRPSVPAPTPKPVAAAVAAPSETPAAQQPAPWWPTAPAATATGAPESQVWIPPQKKAQKQKAKKHRKHRHHRASR